MALNNIHLRVSAASTSTGVDNPSFHLDYQATGGTPTITNINTLITNVTTKITNPAIGAGSSLTAYWNKVIGRTANTGQILAYDVTGHLTGTPYGSPVASGVFTPSPVLSAGSFPEGCCIVVTFQAPYGSDVEFGPGSRPRSRDRGRVYFGPVYPGILGANADNSSNILAASITDMLANFHGLTTVTDGALTWLLCVWSRKNGIMKPLSELWCDNRVDYQRRRSDQPGLRTYLAVP